MATTINKSTYIGFAKSRLDKFLSKTRIHPEFARPAIWDFEDLVVIPGIRGLYRTDGSRVDCSNLLYVTDQSLLSDGDKAKFEASWGPAQLDMRAYPKLQKVRGTTRFFGNYGGERVGGRSHYGHFITDHSSRLWNSFEVIPTERRLFVPLSGSEEDRGRRYMAEILRISRLEGPRSDAITVPTVFEHVRIVESALQVRHAIYHNADTMFVNAAESILRRSDGVRFGSKIYLSRVRLAEGMRYITNEQAVEDHFVKRGYQAVSPETLPLAHQIRIFNSAEKIAGFAGSAFHTGMFSFKTFTGKLIIISGEEPLNGRLFLQAAIKNSTSVYLKAGNYTPNVAADQKPTITVDLDLLRGQVDEADA